MSSSWTVSAVSQRIAFSEICWLFDEGYWYPCLPKPITTTYGLNYFSYTAAKFWNALPDKLRALSPLHDFILAIRRYRLIN